MGNIAADTAPAVQVCQRYPAVVTLTVDDAGMTAGADTYYANTVLPIADAEGVPVGAAITVGYPLAQTIGFGVSGVGQRGAGCGLAFDVAHVLHEHGCVGNSVHGERDSGDIEHQQ